MKTDTVTRQSNLNAVLNQSQDKLALDKLVQYYFDYVREKADYYTQKNAVLALKSDAKTFAQNCDTPRLIVEFYKIFELLELSFKVKIAIEMNSGWCFWIRLLIQAIMVT